MSPKQGLQCGAAGVMREVNHLGVVTGHFLYEDDVRVPER